MLKIKDKKFVIFKTSKFFYKGTIIKSAPGWFFGCTFKSSLDKRHNVPYCNSIIFRDYHLNPDSIYVDVLGYHSPIRGRVSDIWPWCKSCNDVIKILKYLDRILNNYDKNFIDLKCYEYKR